MKDLKEIKLWQIAIFAVLLLFIGGYAVHIYQRHAGNHITQSEVSEYAYVASSQRDIYHRPNCRWAQKISPNNLVGFKTKAEAEKSGRRACKVCKP